MWNVTKQDVTEYAKLANASQILYGPLIFMTKLSILLLFLRVFIPTRTSKTFFFVHLLLWTNLVFYLINTFIKIFECTPRSKIWMPKTEGHCVRIAWMIIVAAIINVISDFTILILPIASVWGLQMGRRQKLGASAVFAAGIFGCVSSIMRLIITVQNSNEDDLTYAWFGEFLWTSAEITSGIICSCVPALPAFVRHFYAKAATRLSKDRDRQHDNSVLFTYRDSEPPSPVVNTNTTSNAWYNPDDSRLLQRSYVELQERSYWDSWDEEEASVTGVTTTATGGASASQETITLPPAVRRSMKDMERGGMHSGILKTVTVAQYPKSMATAH